ncbi:glycoside hydrolase [Marasmius fiardii PR-910]|nr:glycoside hydrolase [Marasmius fiardii PR-910]
MSTPATASYPNLPLPPLPNQQRFFGQDPNATRTSIASSGYQTSHDNSSAQFLYHDGEDSGGYRDFNEKSHVVKPGSGKRKRNLIIGIAVAAVAIIAIAVAVPLAILNKNKGSNASSKSGSGGSHGSGSGDPGKSGGTLAAVTGGNGSDVTLEDGTKIQYSNPHGGYWYYDINDPFNNGARAQSWSPALNETFRYGVDKIRGVNLGGWLVLEPFICPAPFEKYQPEAVDEYTLHPAMAADTANGGADQLEDHYKTFITEKDFAEIAGAGLNYVRLPIPYWAVAKHPSEPYIDKVAWKYFLKAIQWARKYGIRINLDLHTVPGSQNVWNHSGRRGNINFLQGPMGYANAQRTLDVIRVIAEFISQPEYRDVVTMFGPINEPTIDQGPISSFYAQAYSVIREASGTGEGPWISFHDAMLGKDKWIGFLPGADRIAIDSHPYAAFDDVQTDAQWDSRTGTPCQWGREFNQSMAAFGLSVAGEWSNAINDCGLWLNGIPEGTRYDGTYTAGKTTAVGSCDKWTDWQNFSDDTKARLKTFALASMDGLQNYFFWTWKIGASLKSGKVESPAWSYQLGLENGWMPTDPREAAGACGNPAPFTGTINTGTGQVDLANYPWPPASIKNAGAPVTDLPKYTPTGVLPTLAGATFPPTGAKPTRTADLGSGWANSNDKTGMMVEIEGCNYPDAWVNDTPVPSPWCNSAKKRDHVDLAPGPTSAP